MQTDAEITVKESQLETMIEEVAVGYHEEIYINVAGDEVRLLAGNPGHSAGTYCEYDDGWFEGVSGSCEAYVDVEELEDYLGLVGGDMADRFVLIFESASEGNRMSERLRIVPEEGTRFEVTLMLPSGRHVLDAVPTGLPNLFNEEDRLIEGGGDGQLACEVETFISQLQKIRDAVELKESQDYFPIVVRDGELTLDVGDERDQRVSASLNGEVEGPDVDCLYQGHFSDIVDCLNGDVILNLEQDTTMAIIQDVNNRIVRHVIGAAA
jgi:hypothetical protein